MVTLRTHDLSRFGTVLAVLAGLLCWIVPMQAAARTLSPDATAADIQHALDAARPGEPVRLAAGTYRLDAPLTIRRDGVRLVGAGTKATRLVFTTKAGDFVRLEGSPFAGTDRLSRTARAGATEIVLAVGHGVRTGDMVHVFVPNTRRFLARWKNLRWKEAKDRPFRETLHRVAAVDGGTVRLATPLLFDMPADRARLRVARPLHDAGIADLAISSDLGTADRHDFTNPLPAFAKSAALRLTHTIGAVVANVAILNAPSKALVLDHTVEAAVAGLTVRGAHNKGGGGNGYGVELREAFDNRVEAEAIHDMRHAVIFSAWHAEGRNRIHVGRTNRDINFHGSLDLANVVSADEVTLEYAPDRSRRKRRNVWRLLSPGGTNHAETDFLADNTVRLASAVGSWRDDTLVGAAGARLTGAFGRDRFVVTGDATITDFEMGDTLVLPAPGRVAQHGTDVVVTFAGATVLLPNADAATVRAALEVAPASV